MLPDSPMPKNIGAAQMEVVNLKRKVRTQNWVERKDIKIGIKIQVNLCLQCCP